MTDRELLERAAMAAGKRITGWNTAQGEEVAVLEDGSFWQPLHKNRITDADGDALRLAVKCSLRVFVERGHPAHGITGAEVTNRSRTLRIFECCGNTDAECEAATRRAIVRAAASLVPPNAWANRTDPARKP